uniref:Major facilitator superfamily (MFS) profile domain-containing protein n=1 Tax=Globodera rostochiensis TaxID=31243 RepID=A0A914IFY6_GLORO
MFMTSLWPFMKILDKTVAESFYGLVLALYSISQIITSPLLGYWSNRIERLKPPLIFCNLMMLLGNILYLFVELFPTHHYRYALCTSRFMAGVGWAQLGLLKSYVAAASLVADRSRATAFITGGFALGVILGPALQTLFTLVNYPGFPVCFVNRYCINISMFTVPAIFASLVNVALMILLMVRFRESHVGIIERVNMVNETLQIKKSTKLPPYDRCAVAVCFALRFTQFFVFTIIETIGTSFAMLMFNWSPIEVVFYDSMAHAVRGVVALLVYVAYIIFDLGKIVNDRIVCLLSLVALLFFYLITHTWPFLPEHVRLMNSSFVGNSSANSGGCNLNKYAWCAGLPRVNPWLYYGAIVLLIGPAFPNINVAMNTLFSRIIGPRIQSTQQGLLEMHGAIGRLIGPLLISFFYLSYGVPIFCRQPPTTVGGGPNYQFPDQQRLFVLISGTFRLIIEILGLPMNSFLAFITLKNKELWTTSGILLAIVALCDAIVSSSPFILFYFAITGNIACILSKCMPNFVGPYGNVVGKISLGFSVMIIACYLLLFGFIKFVYKATHKNSQETAQKILKSLTVIVMIYLAGWVATQIIKYNQQFFLPPNLLSQVLSTTSGAIIALTEIITAPVLYLTSLNYQASIKVQPMQNVHISRHPPTFALAKKSNNNFNLCLASIS